MTDNISDSASSHKRKINNYQSDNSKVPRQISHTTSKDKPLTNLEERLKCYIMEEFASLIEDKFQSFLPNLMETINEVVNKSLNDNLPKFSVILNNEIQQKEIINPRSRSWWFHVRSDCGS